MFALQDERETTNKNGDHLLKEKRLTQSSSQRSIDAGRFGSTLKPSSGGGEADACHALLDLKERTSPPTEAIPPPPPPPKPVHVTFAPNEKLQSHAQDYLKLFDRPVPSQQNPLLNHPLLMKQPPVAAAAQSAPPMPPLIVPALEAFEGMENMQMPFTPAGMCMFATSMAQYWTAMANMAKQHLQQHEAQLVQSHAAPNSRRQSAPSSTARTPVDNMQMPIVLPLPVTRENTTSFARKRPRNNATAVAGDDDEEESFFAGNLQAQRFGSVTSLSQESRRIHEANNNLLLPPPRDPYQQYYPPQSASSSGGGGVGYNAFDDDSDNDPPIEDNSEDDTPHHHHKSSSSSTRRASNSAGISASRVRGSNGNNLIGTKVSFYAWDGILIDQVKDRSNDIRITRVCTMDEWLACFEDWNAITPQEYNALAGLIHDPNIDRIVESLRQAARHNNRKNDALYKKAFGWDYLKDQMKIGRTQMITTIYWTTYVIYLYHHPAMQHLKMDRDTFLNERVDRNNPHFQNIDNLEIERLLQYRNALICAFQIIPPHRNEVMMLKIGACVERSGRKYQISSSGQMLSTTRRRTLYRIEAAAFESNVNSGETPITAYITDPNSGKDVIVDDDGNACDNE